MACKNCNDIGRYYINCGTCLGKGVVPKMVHLDGNTSWKNCDDCIGSGQELVRCQSCMMKNIATNF